MSTDLKQREQMSPPQMETIVLPALERGSRWPLIAAAAIVLAVAVTGSVLTLTQDEPPGSFPNLNTAVREGPGDAQVDTTAGFTDLRTQIREAPGSIQVIAPAGFPALNTAAREGGATGLTSFADAPGRGHVIPRPAFDPTDYAQYAGTGHVPPER